MSSEAANVYLPENYEFDFTSPSFVSGVLPYEPWTWLWFQKPLFDVNMVLYALSKLANALFAQELQRHLDEQGVPILSLSLHPGEAGTDGSLSIFAGPFKSLLRQVMLTSDQGSYHTLFAATAGEIRERAEKYKGRYMVPMGEVKAVHPVAEDEEQARKLWETTAAEVDRYLAEIGHGALPEW